MTNESNTTEEQLFTEEEKIKQKFRYPDTLLLWDALRIVESCCIFEVAGAT